VIALVVGTLLAIGAMAFVLAPLFREPALIPAPARRPAADAGARERAAVDALREIEFDRATGKLADGDYAALKARYTAEAVAALRAGSAASARQVDESDVEAAIRRAKEARAAHPACPVHGPRPEDDALYCSDCGRFLGGACAHCGATSLAPGARFCEHCGHRLAA
jgi:hypothetical protein